MYKNQFLYFIWIFFLNVTVQTFGQEKRIIQIQGLITNTLNEPLPYVFVYDKFAQRGYLTNEKGELNIFTERGTELIFSCVGYKKHSFLIPLIGNNNIMFLRIKLLTDTILLNEVTIFPWKTYQQFVQAFLNSYIPKDEITIAEQNFEMLKSQLASMETDDYFQSPSVAFKLQQQQWANNLYWKGQTQPMQIFNIVAWQKFLEYIRKGKFKNPNKNNN